MESLITSLLRDYFETLFHNFDAKKDFQFRLSKGEVICSNLELNESVVREIIGIQTLGVKRLRVSNCLINVTPTKISSVPVTIEVDFVDIVLCETDPQPIPEILSKLFRKKIREKDTDYEKKEDYGLMHKIADGIQIKVNKIHVVVQCKGSVDDNQSTLNANSPPLLVLTLENLFICQTDSEWKIVDLDEARKFPNQTKDEVYVFRKLQTMLNTYLVPCNSEEDASFSLLKGSKLWDFPLRHADKTQGHGPLGSTQLFSNMPIEVRLIVQRKLSQGVVGIQSTLLLNNIKLELDHVQAEMTINFLLAIITLLRKQTSKEATRKPKVKDTKHSKVNFKQLMRKTKKRKTQSILADENSAGPRIIFHLSIPKIQLTLKSNPDLVATYPDYQKYVSFTSEVHHLYLTYSGGTTDNKIFEEQYQMSMQWIEFSATAASQSYKLLLCPAGGQEIMSGLIRNPITIHPVIKTEDDNPDFRGNVLEFIRINRSPCPPPPSYGTEVQLRLRRFDMMLYEDVILVLLMHLESVFPSDNANESSSSLVKFSQQAASTTLTDSSQVSAQSSSMSIASAMGEKAEETEFYSTFYCTIDINGPNVYIIPTQLVRPMLQMMLEKIYILGHIDLPEPIRSSQGDILCSLKNPSTFPSKPTDFSARNTQLGEGVRVTKLEIMMRPFGLYYLGDKVDAIDNEQPLLGSRIFEIPELQGGLFWDFSASPQFQLSIMVKEIFIEIRHEQLHLLKLIFESSALLNFIRQLVFNPQPVDITQDATASVIPKKRKKRKIKINDLLYLIPNPGTAEINEEFVEEISKNILSLLPTYIFGFFFKNTKVIVFHKKEELLNMEIVEFQFMFEHQNLDSVRNDELLIFKFSVDDAHLWWPSSEGSTNNPSSLLRVNLDKAFGKPAGQQHLIALRMEQIASDESLQKSEEISFGNNDKDNAALINRDESILMETYTYLPTISSFIRNFLSKYTFFNDNVVVIRLGDIEYSMKLSTLIVIPTFLDYHLNEIRHLWNVYQQGAWTNYETQRMAELKELREQNLQPKLIRKTPAPFFAQSEQKKLQQVKPDQKPLPTIDNRLVYELLDHVTANANSINEDVTALSRLFSKSARNAMVTTNAPEMDSSFVVDVDPAKRRAQIQSFSSTQFTFTYYSSKKDSIWLKNICETYASKTDIVMEELIHKMDQLLSKNPSDQHVVIHCFELVGNSGAEFANMLINSKLEQNGLEYEEKEKIESTISGGGSSNSSTKGKWHLSSIPSISGMIKERSKQSSKKETQIGSADSPEKNVKHKFPSSKTSEQTVATIFQRISESVRDIKKETYQLASTFTVLMEQSEEIERLRKENEVLKSQMEMLKQQKK